MTQKNNGSPILKQKKPWVDNHNDIWLASTLSLFRNIDSFKFPGKMTAERRKQVLPLLSKELVKSPDLDRPVFISAEEISPIEKEYLVEHFLSTFGYQGTHAGEGFIIDQSGQFLSTLNIHDHLHLHMIDVKGELEKSWNHLVKIEMQIGNSFAFAFSPRFGFLTSNPENCGTALHLSLFLQPTALIHSEKIEEFIEANSDGGFNITGLQGNPEEIIGDVLKIQNQYTLGLNEENILSSLRAFATKLVVEEGRIRNEIKNQESAIIKDKVSRAFGVLIHSYQIDPIEALDAISLLKLGSELDWLEGANTASLNELFFNCRRAHLFHNFGENISQDELPHKRAEFIHKALKNIKLKI